MTERLQVEIWSDVMCPWCAVGYAQFARAMDALEGEIAVETRWMPFELAPDLPPEGRPLAEHLAETYGRTPDQAETMRAQMHEAAARAGFPMDYIGPGRDGGAPPGPAPEPMMWNTLEAHKLLRWVLAEAGWQAQTRLKLALLRAHFQQRRNVSDRAVLLDIAQGEGLDRAAAAQALADEALGTAVRREEQRARDDGITAVPTFVINGRYVLQGASEPAAFALALRRIASMGAAA